jgi:hypothetical protein
MAVTNVYSGDKQFFTNENHPQFTWTCVICWCLVLGGNRTAHKKAHAAGAVGFGQAEHGKEAFGT